MSVDKTIFLNYQPLLAEVGGREDDISSNMQGSSSYVPENEVIANRGRIGGWTINDSVIRRGKVLLNSQNEQILLGSATAPLVGTGIFIGKDGAVYEFRAGNPSGAYIHWDGTNFNINSPTLTSVGTGTDISLQQATHNLVFSVTDADTIAWASGTITMSSGQTYSINAGNTGNMSALTYIYLDPDTSTTVLQTSTTYSDAVAANKLLIGVAQNQTTTASYIPFMGGGKTLLDGEQLGALSVGTAVIGNAVITNAKINDMAVSKLTAGTITSKAIVLAADGSGDSVVRAGKTDFDNTQAGFILGIDDSDSDKAKFYIGDTISYINWDGAALTISGDFNVDKTLTAGEDLSAGDAVGLWGHIIQSSVGTNGTVTTGDMVNQFSPTTNSQDTGYGIDNGFTDREKHALYSWTNLADDLPSGATILKMKFFFFVNTDVGNDVTANIHPNTSSYTHGSVTWNTKPSTSASIGNVTGGNGGGWIDSGWVTVTSTQFTDIAEDGITLNVVYENSNVFVDLDDEDDANPAYVLLEYEIQNGEVFKAEAGTAKYAHAFVGLAKAVATEGSSVSIRTEGPLSGLSGLTSYSTYYLSNTAGSYGTSPGSTSKIIGRSLSTTELQVKYAIT